MTDIVSSSIFSTCDLYDRFAERARVMALQFVDYGGLIRFYGPIVTVKCFEDNSRLKELVATPGQGRVLVVDGGGSMRCALLGDVIASEAVASGWRGVVISGCIRDRNALRLIKLGVKALGTTPRKSVRRGTGEVGAMISLAGITCVPGDALFADEDGVLILNASDARSLMSTQ